MSLFRDLAFGARFALAGGREGWTRTLLTAVGVGLGVALLLGTTALPGALTARQNRDNARNDYGASIDGGPAKDTLLLGRADTQYKGADVRGRLVQAEGPQAPVPPGVAKLPAPGTMVASPALRDLLASPDGALLRERIPYRITATIADQGLMGPHELAYYAGSDTLAQRKSAANDGGGDVQRVKAFVHAVQEKLDPILALLIVIIFVVLLMPVGVFIAAAVRFGGDRRDRRLAALRLAGADRRMTRWMAAGEALAGAAVGVVVGAVFFLIGRQYVGDVSVAGLNVFPSDIDPSPLLAVVVALAVPASAVAVTLFAMRSVVVEPLGVVRTSAPRRRRMWWRVLPPLAGAGLLLPMMGRGRDHGMFNQAQVISGTVLLLIGVTALLPWLVEAVVGRLGGGPVGWQLAMRRLQLTSGSAARMVNGIAVAVAGAIALQMLFGAVEGDYVKANGEDTSRAQVMVPLGGASPDAQAREIAALKGTEGVSAAVVLGSLDGGDTAKEPQHYTPVTVGTCADLRQAATLPSCKDGDAFIVTGGDWQPEGLPTPGGTLYLDPTNGGSAAKGAEVRWTVPATTGKAVARPDPAGQRRPGILVTPGALPPGAKLPVHSTVFVSTTPGDALAKERVLTLAAKADPLSPARSLTGTQTNARFAGVRQGLYIGAAAVLMLIGASLLVSMLEQLRERKKLLSALVAFGTRRSTLSYSVLWQTTVPVALGLALAAAVGLGLGSVLLRMVGRPVAVDWVPAVSMVGIGAGVVLLVTALSLPPLWRLMRPEGLRTE
ncbi:FtsX-like permease family protein [Streptomyces sp. NBC_00083]|uniref:FtsX-like permease family protein n=1 Tax=Streptomyces sp. NBC_00083 TaxID=2975647 RepID=UPI0022518905|nr:FtsX-like permease family protein [Streptomyces sp. NBC_00083]MCX5385337.1 FtsX-like permease family protein [Streptomyces sp. NBC_00083]